MICPRCHSEFETMGDSCPECGVTLVRNVSGIMKTSAVMIAARGERGFYNSVKDVPEPLRTELLETTTSQNSGTIVIADRAGKEQLTQARARREVTRGTATSQKSPLVNPVEIESLRQMPRRQWIAWTGLLVVLILAAIISAFFYLHW